MRIVQCCICCGSAAAQCGKALPFRQISQVVEAMPQPQRGIDSRFTFVDASGKA